MARKILILLTKNISLDESELVFTFIRAPGPGGQNVNKVASAVLLRFNIINSSLPDETRKRLLDKLGNKITLQGDLLIKASRFRTQERNKQDAINRLVDILKSAMVIPKKRKKTKPSLAEKERRLNKKKLRGKAKSLRSKKFE